MADLGTYVKAGSIPWPKVNSGVNQPWTPNNSTVQVLPSNPARSYMLIVADPGNTSTGFVGVNQSAATGQGIPLAAGAGYEMTQGAGNVDPGVITIFTSSTTDKFYVQEAN